MAVDGWNKIKEDGYPQVMGWFDCYSYSTSGGRIIKKLYFEGCDAYGDGRWRKKNVGDWWYMLVTHWRERPLPPKE